MEQPAENATGQGSTTPEGGTETILLVDDEGFIRRLGERILGAEGYSVLTARDGEAALELYGRRSGEIDLVILDLLMTASLASLSRSTNCSAGA